MAKPDPRCQWAYKSGGGGGSRGGSGVGRGRGRRMRNKVQGNCEDKPLFCK